jgi:hypothetical protein
MVVLCIGSTTHAAEIGDTAGQEGKTDSSPVANAPEAGGNVAGLAVNVWAEDMHVTTSIQSSGSAPAGPVCTYTPLALSIQTPGQGGTPEVSYRQMYTHEPADGPGDGIETFMSVTCPDGTSSRWVPSPEAVDLSSLISAARDRASRSVPAPVPNMNPDPSVGAPVQLGLWLAVDDPGQVDVVAQAGPVWAAVTVRFVGMDWDMGNGATVACDGVGTPYPAGSGTADQGPCGYTYRLPSDLGTRTVTATGRWTAQLTTSTGVDQDLGPLTSANTFTYPVYEVVTVGGPGG